MASTIEKLSLNDRTALAAVALATDGGTIDWEAVTRIAGSKTAHAMRERVRMAKKRFEEQSAVSSGTSSSPSGVKKRTSPSKASTAAVKKVATSKKKPPPVKKELEDIEEDDGMA